MKNLSIVRAKLSDLHPDPANTRAHDERNIDAIKASLARFGQVEPLVVQASSKRVIGGNGRLAAMKDMGWTDADVVMLEVDDVQATAMSIALNRTAELASWDMEALKRTLDALEEAGAMEGVGFSPAELDKLFPVEATAVEDEGPDEPPTDAVAQRGDVWLLGDHRLMCGDSTSAEDVDTLMDGEKASLCATDPPYLVDYTGERPNGTGKDWSADYREIDIVDAAGFFQAVFKNVIRVIAPKSAIYCWHAHKRCGTIQLVWESLGILDHQQIVWVKPTPVFGRVYWHFRHEPCMMGWVEGSKPEHDGQHEYDSVWEIAWEGGKSRIVGNEHPTQKPVEIFARPMKKHTKPGDIVFEPFSGSGSQLVAAEQMGRRCRAMEISPAFVDVAIRRWQRLTSKFAVRQSDGVTFDEATAFKAKSA